MTDWSRVLAAIAADHDGRMPTVPLCDDEYEGRRPTNRPPRTIPSERTTHPRGGPR